MYAAPPSLEATVHARLPDTLRQAGRQTEWTRLRAVQYPDIDSFLEGPAFDRQGNLHMVNMAFGQILTLSPDGNWKVSCEYDGEPNGLAIHSDGRLFVADGKWGIVTVDPASGKAEHLLTRVGGERFKGCNDLVFSRQGDLYFTDQGHSGLNDPTGRVFRLRSNGRLECLLDNLPSPNGIALSGDERTLFVSVTRGNCIWRVPLVADGSVNRVGLYIQLSGSRGGPDGIALDQQGGMAVAHFMSDSLWLFDGWGEPALRIRNRVGRRLTNVCYGGPEHRTLFMTEAESGTILRADVPVPGLRLFSHA